MKACKRQNWRVKTCYHFTLASSVGKLVPISTQARYLCFIPGKGFPHIQFRFRADDQ